MWLLRQRTRLTPLCSAIRGMQQLATDIAPPVIPPVQDNQTPIAAPDTVSPPTNSPPVAIASVVESPGADNVSDRFQPGDLVIIREVLKGKRMLTAPLKINGKTDTHRGMIQHSQMIGKPPRSKISTHLSNFFTVHHPTLEEYILLASRHCTPIYAKDASAIISLLDVQPGDRILDCGTGNGALTMRLAGAVAGHAPDGQAGQVVTVEGREAHAQQAKHFVRHYRRGALLPWIDFRFGMLGDVLTTDQFSSDYFDGVVLDMPTPSLVLSAVHRVLRNDGYCVCYLPNMTQIIATAQAASDSRLAVERVVEVDWREWDVRGTRPAWVRRKMKQEAAVEMEENQVPPAAEEPAVDAYGVPAEELWVCRPKHMQAPHTAFLMVLRKCDPVRSEEVAEAATATDAATPEPATATTDTDIQI